MSVSTTLCNTFVDELLEGRHAFQAGAGHTFKTALVKPSSVRTYGTGTTNLTDLTQATSDEASGTGYSTGGATSTVASTYPKLETGSTFVVDFDDTTWASSTISAEGALLYNTDSGSGTANRSVACYSFGGTVSSSNGNFTIQWAAPGASAGTVYINRL